MFRQIIAALVCFLPPLVACHVLFAGPVPAPAFTSAQLYCSGIVSRAAPPLAGVVVSGEDASDKMQFFPGDDVYLHLDNRSDVKTSGQFLVVRGTTDPMKIPWFRGEESLEKSMGRLWKDVGRVRVVKLGKSVAVARIESSCAAMEPGDLLVPFEPRTSPPLPAAQLKMPSSVPANGNIGRVVSAKDFHQVLGSGSIAYVNLGTRKGAKVGDQLILFRIPGATDSELPSSLGAATQLAGFGTSTARYPPHELPREVLGQGVVLRVSPTAATVLITASSREIELGDYAELE
jgi:hypothetical protein